MEKCTETESLRLALPCAEVATHWSHPLASFRHENCDIRDVLKGEASPIFAISNENWWESILEPLCEDNPTVSGNAYLCVGGLSHLFLFASSEKLEYLINFDPNLDESILWNLFCLAICRSKSPEETVSALLESIRITEFNDPKMKKCDVVLLIYGFFVSKKSPFLIPGGFEKIQKAAIAGNIQSFCVNVNTPLKAKEFSSALSKVGIKARVVNGSNLNAEHWSEVVAPDALSASLNYLASPEKGKNVHFLVCSPSRFETKCSCRRKVLQNITTNKFDDSPGTKCTKGINHMMTFLNRMEEDVILMLLTKFTTAAPFSHEEFLSKVVHPNLNRVSLDEFKLQLFGDARKTPAVESAKDIYTKIYEGILVELQTDGIKEHVFIDGITFRFASLKALHKKTPYLKGSLVPECVIYMKLAFDLLQEQLKIAMK